MADKPNEIKVEDWKALFKAISGLQADVSNKIIVTREVVPVIFVPGIMGTRLKDSSGKSVWDPDDSWLMVKEYGIKSSPKNRKNLLVGPVFKASYLTVNNEDAEHNKKFLSDIPGAAKRGWGGVAWSSYGAFLIKLQSQAWSEPVRHCFEFPVHAFGYNWSASNDLSGMDLKAYIDDVTKDYSAKGRRCEKVILVTHSMGGLVARSACKLHSAESKVLGVIHGVQPATGSGGGYWRMKAGFERPGSGPPNKSWNWLRSPVGMLKYKVLGQIGSMVLGKDGEGVTVLLGNMPGGLQLLPNKLYTDNEGSKQWLRYPDLDGTTEISLPKSDPYEEIYRAEGVFYGAVNPDWLDPGWSDKAFDDLSPWENYLIYLREAESFHDKLGDKLFDQTVQFYSVKIGTADKIRFTREEDTWMNKAKRLGGIVKDGLPGTAVTTGGGALIRVASGAAAFTPAGLAVTAAATVVTATLKDSDWYVKRGGYRVKVDVEDRVIGEEEEVPGITWLMNLIGPSGSGDGTVAESSGKALKTKESLSIGDEDESWFSRSHEPIYQTKMAQHITFSAIENFCLQKIKERAG